MATKDIHSNPYNINTINQIRHNKLGLSGNPLQVIYVEYYVTDNDPSLQGKHKLLNKIKGAAKLMAHPPKAYICTFETNGMYLLELDFDDCTYSGQGKFIQKQDILQINIDKVNDITNKFTITTAQQSLTYQVPIHIGLIDQPKDTQQLQALFNFQPNPKHVNSNDVGYMFCHHCGKKISADSTFCHYCGAKQQPEVTTSTSSNNEFYYDLKTTAPSCSDADSDKAVINYIEKMGFDPSDNGYKIGKYKYTDYIYVINSRGLIILTVDYHEGSRYTASYYSFTNSNQFITKNQINKVTFKQHLVKLYVYLNGDSNPIRFTIPKIFKNADTKLQNDFEKLANN